MGLFSSIGKAVKSVGSKILPVAGGAVQGYLSGGWGGALAGGVGALAGNTSAKNAYDQSVAGAQKQNQLSMEAVKNQERFQTRSYKHRYQWQMDDMKAAGLNPLLAYQTGAGSALGGSTYQPVNEAAAAVGAHQAATSARAQSVQASVQAGAAKHIRSQIKATDASVRQTRATTANTKQDTHVKEQAWKESIIRQENISRMNTKLQEETNVLRHKVTSAKAAAKLDSIDEKFWSSKAGRTFRNIDRIGTSINPMRKAVTR